MRSFPLDSARAFLQAPLCLCSLPRKFDRNAHRCREWSLELGLQDIVLLATDAVASWLLSHADQHSRWQAFLGLVGMTENTWRPFLAGCRQRREMSDDDATIMIVRFHDTKGDPLGCTVSHDPAVVAERRQALREAIQAQDKERIAILAGSSQDALRLLSATQLEDARLVAHALDDVRQTYIRSFQRADAAVQTAQAWSTHEELFSCPENRASVEGLLQFLQGNGVLQDIVLPACSAPNEVATSQGTFWTWLHAAIRRLVSR